MTDRRVSLRTREGVVRRLIDGQLLSPPDVVGDRLSVRSVGGRNQNFLATLENRRGYFLKFASQTDGNRGRLLGIEAAVYENADSETSLASVLTRRHLYDAGEDLLVLEHLRGGYEPEGPGYLVASALGRAIAAIHRTDASTDAWAFLPQKPPWALDLARPRPRMLSDMSQGQVKLVGLVQKSATVCQTLDHLREGWTPDGLTHGDIKWANIIVEPRNDGEVGPVVKVLDWELATFGDRTWDVGSVFHSYLAQAILAVDLPAGARPADVRDALADRWPAVKREHRAFWSSYMDDMAAEETGGREIARRASLYCGARLIQSAYEWSRGDKVVSRRALPALQLGINIIENPMEAITHVIGIDDGAAA